MSYSDQLPKTWANETVKGFPLSVSKASFQRGRAALTAMLEELRSLGHEPKQIDHGYRHGLFIDVFGVACELSMREKCRTRRISDPLGDRSEMVPTGELVLKMTYHGFPVEWADKKRRRLEDAIPQIAKEISTTVRQWENRRAAEDKARTADLEAQRREAPRLMATGLADLDSVMRAWTSLPCAVKVGIVAMVQATTGLGA